MSPRFSAPKLRTIISLTFFISVIALYIMFGVISRSNTANAADISKFNPGQIISDSIFTNKGSMNTTAIQNFLNSKVPSCDTSGQQLSEYGGPDLNGDGKVQRWEWGKQNYNQTTFTCLRNYSEGGKSAAQIIYETAQNYNINPQVLIVLLQKEQALVTDTWPLNVQYRTATGYGCPDTAACDTQYYGFTNQVRWAATMFRAIMTDSPTWYTPYVLGNNSIPWNPNTGACGYSTVNIQNRATQALYNYTPYRPNQAALNAGYGTGDGCSSYGNRNFFLYFSDWFGSTSTDYDATFESITYFSDTARTAAIDLDSQDVAPGQPVYARLVVKNTGNKNLDKSFIRVATIDPRNRSDSAFYDSSWLSRGRPTTSNETTIAPGSNATFDFTLNAPYIIGSKTEKFGLVAENKAWINSINFPITISTVAQKTYDGVPVEVSAYYDPDHLQPYKLFNGTARPGQKIYVSAKFRNLGTVALSNTYMKVSTVNPRGRTDSSFYDTSWLSASRLAFMSEASVPVNGLGTFNFTLTMPDAEGSYSEDFGFVAESMSNGWIDAKVITPSIEVKNIVDQLPVSTQVVAQEDLTSRNGNYRLVMQGDGNLVLYSTKRAIWSTRTNGYGLSRLVIQGDGNLVIYNFASGKPVWSSRTNGLGASRLILQNDGNLVIYDPSSKPIWATGTNGVE